MLKDQAPDQALYQNFWHTIAVGKQWRGRFKSKRADGSCRISEASIAPVRDTGGRIVNYVSVERDITEHVAVSEQLMRVQKMESVGRLAGGVAHDFNNLLQVILGHAELAQEELGTEHPVCADLRMIRQATDRSKVLTRQHLTFARQQPVTPAVVDLNELVGGMMPMVRKLLGASIELIWKPGENVWSVKIDPVQMQQLMINLCTNARDAIDGAGTVTVMTSTTEVSAPLVAGTKESGLTAGGHVVLTVSDTGCGLSEESRAHLFEPFFTTKKEGRGTGLGLATVYGIVKQNGGRIDVESDPGQGSSFVILLPRSRQDDADAVPPNTREAVDPGHGEWVLVVDDDPVIFFLSRH